VFDSEVQNLVPAKLEPAGIHAVPCPTVQESDKEKPVQKKKKLSDEVLRLRNLHVSCAIPAPHAPIKPLKLFTTKPVTVVPKYADIEAEDDGPKPVATKCLAARICYTVATHSLSEPLTLSLILVSSICLAVESPYNDPTTRAVTFLDGLNTSLSLIFAVEMVVKMIAFGIILPHGDAQPGETPYLRDGWHWIDFVVVVCGIFDIVYYMVASKTSQLKMLRGF